MPARSVMRSVRVLVVTGGMVGTLLRALVATAVPFDGTGWPWATLVVNLVGAGALGWLLGWLGPSSVYRRAFLGTGVLGSFTTFSTFAVDVVALRDRPAVAVAYAVVSVLAGLALAAAGLWAVRRPL